MLKFVESRECAACKIRGVESLTITKPPKRFAARDFEEHCPCGPLRGTSSGRELKVLIADLCAVTLKVDGILSRFGNKSGLHLPPANLDQSIGTLPQNLRLDVCVPLGGALLHELKELKPCLILCHHNIVAPALGQRNDFRQQSPTTSQ